MRPEGSVAVPEQDAGDARRADAGEVQLAVAVEVADHDDAESTNPGWRPAFWPKDMLLSDVGFPQLPAWHVSPLVQGLLSSQVVPLARGRVRALTRRRIARARGVALVGGGARLRRPGAVAGAVADRVQVARGCCRCRSCPAAPAGLEHCPVPGLQVPATWH